MAISNLYAEKVYAANPSVLWSLDDELVTSPTSISSIVGLPLYGAPAYAYGRDDNYGYYVSKDSTIANIAGSNSGVPMVYGATNISAIYENKISSINYPSLIFPGYGFLNKVGENSSYTVEMWLRINSNSKSPRKIFGQITGNDGLYVNGPFISLRVGNNVGSHYISEWGRPMIIHITYTKYSAGLIINGEQVISFQYNIGDVTLTPQYDSNGNNQDWIAFYAYDDVSPIEIDCIAIYPYVISQNDAKLHFVWGQAVESPEIKNSGYSDVPIIIDYQMSKAANSYVYPGTGRWKNGTSNNMTIDNYKISTPSHKLPSIFFESPQSTISDWNIKQTLMLEEDLVSNLENYNSDSYFRIDPRPTGSEWYQDGYLDFGFMNGIISDRVEAFSSILQIDDFTDIEDQIIFKITDNENNIFKVFVDTSGASPVVKYQLSKVGQDGVESVLESVTGNTVVEGEDFCVGINIKDFAASSEKLSSFFNNRSNLKLVCFSDYDFTETFYGKIYRVNFSNSQDLIKINSYFDEDGIAKQENTEDIKMHISTYSLFGSNTFSTFQLDIAISGNWQDYIPLRLLSKEIIIDSIGTKKYGLSFLQFNIDIPEINNKDKAITSVYVMFNDLKTFVPQNIYSVASEDKTTVRVFEPGVDWETKKYQIQTNTVVYPPDIESIDDIAVFVYLDFKIPGIIRNPLEIKSLNISSQAIEYKSQKTPIGTKYGKDIYSYGVVDGRKDYGVNQPFSIYKNSTPYLYLNKYSGIRLEGTVFDGSRGIEIPINQSSSAFYEVGLIQCALFYDKDFDTTDPTEIYRIYGTTTDTYAVYAKGITTTTAYVYVEKNGTKLPDSSVNFFINGHLTEDLDSSSDHPVMIKKNEWLMLGIGFKVPLSFSSSTTGSINITGPFLINNISDYQIKEIDKQRVFLTYSWNEWAANTWSEIETDYTWADLLLQASADSFIDLDGESIYRSYIGSNRLTINELDVTFSISKYNYSVISDISITTQTVIPL